MPTSWSIQWIFVGYGGVNSNHETRLEAELTFKDAFLDKLCG